MGGTGSAASKKARGLAAVGGYSEQCLRPSSSVCMGCPYYEGNDSLETRVPSLRPLMPRLERQHHPRHTRALREHPESIGGGIGSAHACEGRPEDGGRCSGRAGTWPSCAQSHQARPRPDASLPACRQATQPGGHRRDDRRPATRARGVNNAFGARGAAAQAQRG